MATVPQYNGYLNDWVPMIRDAYARGIKPMEIATILAECGVHNKQDTRVELGLEDGVPNLYSIYGIIRTRILKLGRREVKCAVPEKSWTPQSNYEEIESEYV